MLRANNMMQLKPYEECNHATIEAWWIAHEAMSIPHAALPKTGCIAVNEDGVLCAAAWLYLDNSVPVSFMSWMIVNPAARSMEKFDGLNHCIRYLTDHGENLGYGVMVSMSAIPSISKLMKLHGFEIASKGVEILLKG